MWKRLAAARVRTSDSRARQPPTNSGHAVPKGPLPVADAADLLLQACEALAEAHAHGIIHRDLKPGNLFVTTTVDGLPFVKVLDFGISKASFPGDTVLTETEAFFGSPRYMSPEQLACPKDVDARSDVWALGVILYEMLAGDPPFKGDTFPLVCAAIFAGSYAKLSSCRSDIPDALDALVSEALAPKPESRLPTVEAFARRLAPFGTAGARQSCERIERLAPGATHPEIALPQATAAPLAQTADGLTRSQAGMDHPVPTSAASAPARRARSRMAPALLGLAGALVAAGFFGLRHMHAASPTSGSSVLPVASVVPSASSVVMTASPGDARESALVASSVPPASAPVVLAASPAAAPPSAPSTTTGGECAKGATSACEAACAAHAPGRCEALAKALVKGNGGPKDVARAGKLYQAECDAGAGSACNALGALYGAGTEVPRDNAKAVSCRRSLGSLLASLTVLALTLRKAAMSQNRLSNDATTAG